MSSTIKPTQIKRAIAQHTAQVKSELTNKHVSELKNLRTSIQQSHADARALARATPVVNHIKQRSRSEDGDDDMTSTDNSRLYTRRGRMESDEIDDRTDAMEDHADAAQERAEAAEELADELALQKEDRAQEKLMIKENEEMARNEDDFYHVQNRGNTISEDDSGYYIQAYAPEHEKAGIQVSVSNNKAVISGSRKAQNEEETENSLLSTHNYQSFREEFHLGTPAVAHGMTRERNGDFISFFIPKMNGPVNETTKPSAAAPEAEEEA